MEIGAHLLKTFLNATYFQCNYEVVSFSAGKVYIAKFSFAKWTPDLKIVNCVETTTWWDAVRVACWGICRKIAWLGICTPVRKRTTRQHNLSYIKIILQQVLSCTEISQAGGKVLRPR